MAKPHFTMFWSENIPRRIDRDDQGGETEVAIIAGALADADAPLSLPPDSWAARADADVAIWTVRLAPGATWTLPAATGVGTRRNLYFFKDKSVNVAGEEVVGSSAIELNANAAVALVNGDEGSEILPLQGRRIAEPVAQYGPFVMNTQAEIAQSMQDYRRTQFGGWTWADGAPVHGHDPARFAKHPSGREARPESK